MAGERTLKVTILGDAQSARRALAQLSTDGETTANKAVAWGKRIGLAFAAKETVGAIFAIGSQYRSAMNELEAVSGATDKQMQVLRKTAKDLGNDITLPGASAKDAAEAMVELTKGGLSVDQTMKSVKGTMQLAAAAGIGQAQAAEIQANALNAFRLPAEKAGQVADLLANAANASSIEITDASDSFKMASAVFAAFQGPVVGNEQAMKDLTVAIGLMGNAGIKGSDAGTSLKQMLLQLSGPSDKAKTLMQELAAGIGMTGDLAYDAEGRMRPMNEMLGILAKSTATMTQEQRDATITQLFGADASRAVITLLRSQGAETDKMSAALDKQGSAADLAAAKNKGFKGALDGVKSQLETIAIGIYEKTEPALTAMALAMSGVIKFVQENGLPILAALASLVVTVVVPAVIAKATAWWAANSAMLAANAPMVALVAAIAALAAGVVWAYQNVDSFRAIVDTLWEKVKAFGSWLKDIFQGDWDRVWQGVKDTFEGIWNGFVTFVTQWIPQKFLPALADVGAKALAWIGDHAPKILAKLGEWTVQFLGWAADMGLKLLAKLGEWMLNTVLPWIADQAPKLLAKLGEWTLKFLAWVAEMSPKLLAGLSDVARDVLGWIADTALDIAKELPKWTAEFTGWVLGLVPKILAAGADLVGWIGEEAGKLPGQLAHWTAEFVAWMGRLPAEAASAIAGLGQAIGEVVWNWVKDRVSGLNPFGGIGSGGANTGSGGFNIPGRTVPAAGGSAPTNSQGTPGQTFGQMFAAGMTIAEIAEKTGQDPANITAALMREIPGMVLGGDHDDENDGDLSPSGPGEQNLTANAVRLRREIQASFKGYSSIGGYAYRTTAAGTPSDHATGKALDVMMPRLHDPLGDKIAAWAVGENETKYVIWDNQIWSRQKPYWRDYATSGKVGAANQGSATGRHEDHVHISVLGKGGIVRARQGGTLALLGEAGQDEAVVPLPRGGGSVGVGGVHVHVYGTVIRERDLVLSIRDGLLDLQRQGVSLGFN